MKRILSILLPSVVTLMVVGCTPAGPTLIEPQISAEDQRLADQSISERDSEEYAKSFARPEDP